MPSAKTSNVIQIRCSFDSETYNQIKKFQYKNKLAYEQDVIRMAIARFFEDSNQLLHNTKFKNNGNEL